MPSRWSSPWTARPRGLILQSTFTSVRDVARNLPEARFISPERIPDAYPSLRRIIRLTVPLLVLHRDRDKDVPFAHGRALFAAANEPKDFHRFRGKGHNDLVARAPDEYAKVIADWAKSLDS